MGDNRFLADAEGKSTEVVSGCVAYGRTRKVRVKENSCGDQLWVSYRSIRPGPVRLRLRWLALTS